MRIPTQEVNAGQTQMLTAMQQVMSIDMSATVF
jgi:hypothetical protein